MASSLPEAKFWNLKPIEKNYLAYKKDSAARNRHIAKIVEEMDKELESYLESHPELVDEVMQKYMQESETTTETTSR